MNKLFLLPMLFIFLSQNSTCSDKLTWGEVIQEHSIVATSVLFSFFGAVYYAKEHVAYRDSYNIFNTKINMNSEAPGGVLHSAREMAKLPYYNGCRRHTDGSCKCWGTHMEKCRDENKKKMNHSTLIGL